MTFPVKGIETVDEKGDPYVRRDIDKWYAEQVDEKGNRVQLTLFMRALALIQRREVKEELSFFRLAAIHSAPWCEWDGVPQPPDKPPNDPERIRGYCVHNDYTFPTWHRVYMMLYEVSKLQWLVGQRCRSLTNRHSELCMTPCTNGSVVTFQPNFRVHGRKKPTNGVFHTGTLRAKLIDRHRLMTLLSPASVMTY